MKARHPDYVVVVGCGLDRVRRPLGQAMHAVVEAARHYWRMEEGQKPNFLLLSGSRNESEAVERALNCCGEGVPLRHIRRNESPLPTIHARAERMWQFLPDHGKHGQRIEVLVLVPSPLVELVKSVFEEEAKRHGSRQDYFHFLFEVVEASFSVTANASAMRGPKRFGFWAWSAGVYYWLRRAGWNGLWPEPRLE